MIWETRGSALYAERAGRVYRIDRRGYTGAWVLRWRAKQDTGWEVVSEFNSEREAKQAAE